VICIVRIVSEVDLHQLMVPVNRLDSAS